MKAKVRPRCHWHYCRCSWRHCHDGWDRTWKCPDHDEEIESWRCPICRRVSGKAKR